MFHVVVFGAGKSSNYFLKLLCNDPSIEKITVIDKNITTRKISSKINYIQVSINNKDHIIPHIEKSNLVVSLLPAQLHIEIAKICVQKDKNLVTASYVSPEMEILAESFKAKNLVCINEMGLDPGIDHITACALLEELKHKGAIITDFASHTGGIIANPQKGKWNYKFSWNPMNVINAGKEGAITLEEATPKTTTYQTLFKTAKRIQIGDNTYESYANRDSLKYLKKYGLNNIKNLYRGTLRHEGFCKAWDFLIQIGLTDTSKKLYFPPDTSLKKFFDSFKKGIQPNAEIIEKLEEIGWLSEDHISKNEGTAGELLQNILIEGSWKLSAKDRDLVVMLHEITYELDGKRYKYTRSMEVTGQNSYYTAMAKTVGIPLFETVKMLLNKEINLTGVLIPTQKELFQPLLEKLAKHELIFNDEIHEINL